MGRKEEQGPGRRCADGRARWAGAGRASRMLRPGSHGSVLPFRCWVGGVDLHFKLEGSERVDRRRRRRRREFQILKSRLGASFDSTVVGVDSSTNAKQRFHMRPAGLYIYLVRIKTIPVGSKI